MEKHEARAAGSLAAIFSVRLLGLFMIYPVFANGRLRSQLGTFLARTALIYLRQIFGRSTDCRNDAASLLPKRRVVTDGLRTMTDIICKSELGRRDFIYVATGAMAGVGGLFAIWPFIDQMMPDAAVLSAGAPLSVNLSSLLPGQQIVVQWRSHPIFIVRRTRAILKELKNGALLRRLRDPQSRELQQPVYARNWSRSINPEFLVVVGICTHLGCIPTFTPQPGSLSPSWPGGYLCHCHGSKYDLAGRVFEGVPAPLNLPVPPYSFADAHTLLIGQNPKGETFDLTSIEQIQDTL